MLYGLTTAPNAVMRESVAVMTADGRAPGLRLWQKGLLALLLLTIPAGIGLFSYAKSAANDIRVARFEQCGIAYDLLIGQLLERTEPPGSQNLGVLLTQLGILEGQPCVEGSIRTELLPSGGASRLLPLAQADSTAEGHTAFEGALYGLFLEVARRTTPADIPNSSYRLATDLTEGRFLQASRLLAEIGQQGDISRRADVVRELADLQQGITAVIEERRSSLRPITLLASIGPALDAYREALNQTLQEFDRPKFSTASLSAAAFRARGALFSVYDAAVVWRHQDLQRRIEARRLDRQLAAAAGIVMVLLVLSAAGWLAARYTSDVRRRLQNLVKASQRTADGELGLAVGVRGTGKVSELERAFNDMTSDLRRRYQKIIDELETARSSAESSRRYLRNLTDGVPGAVFEFVRSKEGTTSLPFVSAGHQHLTGVSAARVAQDLGVYLDSVLPEDRPALIEALESAGGDDQEFRCDFRIHHVQTGEIRWLHVHGSSPQTARDGSIHRFGQISDVTAQKQLEASLAIALQTAQAAERAKTDFLNNMSHEIRTPMNAILGMSHLALQTQLDNRQRDYLDKIHKAARHLIAMINDILDFSKVEAGNLTAEQIEFDLGDVIDDVASNCQMKAAAKGLSFDLDVADDVARGLIGDPQRLGQILRQFTDNAVKFTDVGRIGLAVRLLRSGSQRVEIRFAVSDTGPGLTAAERGALFQSIRQGDGSSTRKHGGTGIGLVLARQLTELMGGSIGVESAKNSGSTFWLVLAFGIARTLVAVIRSPAANAADSQTTAAKPGTADVAIPQREFDPAVLNRLVEQIDGWDAEAAETIVELREMVGANQSLLDRVHRHLANFDFGEAANLVPDLRASWQSPASQSRGA